MNRVRNISAPLYHFLITGATLVIPLLIFFGMKGQGLSIVTVTSIAILSFLLLLAWLLIPNKVR
ncbi:hypothetical protein [Salinithrix halophila]|uniref:Uncharacterized protein n=1 Tax=Salinithrix halophila TaxID=1485204 RepID=A0ABV8JCA8_9BACL